MMQPEAPCGSRTKPWCPRDAVSSLTYCLGAAIVEYAAGQSRRTHVRPENLRHRPHPRLPRALDGEGAGARLRARSRRDRRRRRAHAGVSRHQPERAAAGHRRRRFRAVRVARHHALSRQEAFAGPALSRHARRRGAGLAVEPVGGHRGRSRRQHLVAARRPPAAGGAGPGQARRGAQGSGRAVQGARCRGERTALSAWQ